MRTVNGKIEKDVAKKPKLKAETNDPETERQTEIIMTESVGY